jgi:hypothetical protein
MAANTKPTELHVMAKPTLMGLDFFQHTEQPMKEMAGLLGRGRYAAA